MKIRTALTVSAMTFGGALLVSTTGAEAGIRLSIGISVPGLSFSYSSGGYCDAFGCPNTFWDYPVAYCPVYWDGGWYGGPFYYVYRNGSYYYWIRGGWRRDGWYQSRPYWACTDRFGPPLDLDFYIWNGFNVRDDWRIRWDQERDGWWRSQQNWYRSHGSAGTQWQAWVPAQQRNYDWSRQQQWNRTQAWSKPDWNRDQWAAQHGIGDNMKRMHETGPAGGSTAGGSPPGNGQGTAFGQRGNGNMTGPQGGMTGPQGGMTGPHGGMNGTQGGMTGPRGGMNGSQGGMNGPQGGMTGPRGGMNGPQGGMNGPQGGMNGPRGGMTGRQGGMNGPRGGMTGPQGGMNGPRGGQGPNNNGSKGGKPQGNDQRREHGNQGGGG